MTPDPQAGPVSPQLATDNTDDSLWSQAYHEFERLNPELSTEFIKHTNVNGKNAEESIRKAVSTVEELRTSRDQSRAGKIRKYLQTAIKYINIAKGPISSAAQASPYASLAWAGVCFVLPFILKPSEENEAASEGLSEISHLIVIYRWRAKRFSEGDGAEDFREAARKLYSAIFEYEALLLAHMNKNVFRRFKRNVLEAGDWASRTTKIRKLDADCKDITEEITGGALEAWHFEERRWQDQLLQQPRLEKERENITLLYSLYEDGKNRNPVREPRTCEWFLSHASFLSWREAQSSRLLWLSAGPGYGKSVLSKYLIDRIGETMTIRTQTPVICYFLFKDENKISLPNDPCTAVCALLHQVLLQKPKLYGKYVQRSFDTKGPGFLKHFDALWSIFENCATDNSDSEFLCVLDALDECTRPSILVKKIVAFQERIKSQRLGAVVKIFVTSRPDIEIERGFKPLIGTTFATRIDAEEETEIIQAEIDYVIDKKVNDLIDRREDLDPEATELLTDRLKGAQNRTYLWFSLVWEILEEKTVLNRNSIIPILDNLPSGVEDAYEAILNKSKEPELARKILQLVLTATRPLTIDELAVALAVTKETRTRSDIRSNLPWPAQSAKSTIKNLCGHFLSIVNSKIYLIHQTAEKFLRRDSNQMPPSPPEAPHLQWKYSFDIRESNLALARACSFYLLLEDFKSVPGGVNGWVMRNTREYCLFPYAAVNWGFHIREAGNYCANDSDLFSVTTQKLCSNDKLDRWYRTYQDSLTERSEPILIPSGSGNLIWAAHFSHILTMQNLLDMNKDPNIVDDYGRTPLAFASFNGTIASVELLLSYGADVNSRDILCQVPLTFAVQRGHTKVIEILLRAGAKTDCLDVFGRDPTFYASGSISHELKLAEDSENKVSPTFNDPNAHVSSLSQEVREKALAEQIQLYIEDRMARRLWISVNDKVLLTTRDEMGPTGLSDFHDNLSAALDALLSREDTELARSCLLKAIKSVPSIIISDSPFVLPYILNSIAISIHHSYTRVAGLFCELFSKPVGPSYTEDHPVRQIIDGLKDLVTDSPSEVPRVSLLLFDSIITTLGRIIGHYHMQTVWTKHKKITLQSKIAGADTAFQELCILTSETEKNCGPTSPQAVQALVSLGHNYIDRKIYDNAEETGYTLIKRIPELLSATDWGSIKNKGMLSEGYGIIAAARDGKGDLDGAQLNFELAANTARRIVGPDGSQARRHRGRYIEWLTSHGRLENLRSL